MKLKLLPGGRGGAAKARERIEEAVPQQHSVRDSGSGTGSGNGQVQSSPDCHVLAPRVKFES